MNSRLIILMLCSIIGWTACTSASATSTPMTCGSYALSQTTLPDCIVSGNHTIIQSPLHQQVQLGINSVEITIRGTAIISNQDDESLSIQALEGTTTIGFNQRILTLNAGQQVSIINDENLSAASQLDWTTVNQLPLDQLQRQITLNLPEPTSTQPATVPSQEDCPAPVTWTDTYIVQTGESLTTIANKINVTVQDLQSANCIETPNSIPVGLSLRVPADSIPATQPNQTFTPSAVFFRADRETITAGDCTVLRWDVQNIQQLTLDDQPITDSTSQQVCPQITTTYTLTVVYFDERQTQHTVTVAVNES